MENPIETLPSTLTKLESLFNIAIYDVKDRKRISSSVPAQTRNSHGLPSPPINNPLDSWEGCHSLPAVCMLL
jgi:hypothetical protein